MKKDNPFLLSVVIIITGDTINGRCDARQLSATLESLNKQSAAAPSLEIIVPFHEGITGIDELKTTYPKVNFLFVSNLKSFKPDSREHHDELRTHGTLAANGQLIAFLEDHVCPRSDWAAQIFKAHAQNFPVIGGAVENGIDKPLNWANYFCDLGKYQNPVPSAASPCASLVNASYKRETLKSVEQVWRERFNETAVNQALLADGKEIRLSREIIVTQQREDLNWKSAVKEFFIWGTSYARTRSHLISKSRRVFYGLFSFALPIILSARIFERVIRRGKFVKFLKAFPFILLLSASWSFGEAVGYFTPQKSSEKLSRTGTLEFGK